MLRSLIVLLLSLCITCGAATAAQPANKQAAKEQKAREKAQRKKIRQESRYYETLRNDAVLKFAREHQPADIRTPLMSDLRISNVVCAGDKVTGTVVLHLDITPLRGAVRLYMGGEHNGTQAIAGGKHYPSQDLYGRIYTLRAGIPEQIIVMFDNVKAGTDVLDRVEISMGLRQNILNIITLTKVPVIWTYSDKTIRAFVQETEADNAN